VHESFSGKLVLHDGSIVGALLTLGDDVLTISAERIEVGTWPLKYCRVGRESETSFRITVDGEPTTFVPTDPIGFATAAAQQFRASSLADRIEVMRSMPHAVDFSESEMMAKSRRNLPIDLPRLPMVLGVAVVSILALIAVAGFSTPRPETLPVSPAEPAATPETAPGTLEPARLTEMSLTDFVEVWNQEWQVAAPGLGELALQPTEGAVLDERITENVSVRVTEGPSGLREVAINTNVHTNRDVELAMAAMAVAIQTADAETTPRDVLEQLNVRFDPEVDLSDVGMGEIYPLHGVRYVLRYVPSQMELVLTLSPRPGDPAGG
jgi:hypothetical protein